VVRNGDAGATAEPLAAQAKHPGERAIPRLEFVTLAIAPGHVLKLDEKLDHLGGERLPAGTIHVATSHGLPPATLRRSAGAALRLAVQQPELAQQTCRQASRIAAIGSPDNIAALADLLPQAFGRVACRASLLKHPERSRIIYIPFPQNAAPQFGPGRP
jgi:hypothetical protein